MKTDKNKNCDVLLTCGTYAYGMACALANSGLDVYVTDCESSATKYSRYVKGYFITPDYNTDEEGYIAELVKLVVKIRPKVILPFFDIKIIARHKGQFPKTTIIPIDDYGKIDLLDNKIDFLAFAKSINVPMPTFISSIDQIDKFPVVIKFPYSLSGNGVKIIRSSNELNRISDQLSKERFYITEYIEGTDFCVDCIRWDNFYQSSVYKSVKAIDYPNGPSLSKEVVENELIQKYAREILDELSYHGVCGFDFRVDEDGQVFLLEANPRYTGGLGVHLESGFNIPLLHYRLAIGERPQLCTFSVGTKTKFLSSAIRVAYNKIHWYKGSNYNVSEDINLKTDIYEDIRKDDIKPLLYQLYHNKRRVITLLFYHIFGIKIKK